MPAFYSGFYYYYPPLLHLIGAAWIKVAGVASLRYLNVALFGALLATAWFGPPASVPRAPRRWAVLLLVANGAFAAHAVRLYVEMLSAVLMLGAIVLLLRLRASRSIRTAVALGLVTGLALMAKQSAPVLIALLAVIAAADLLARRTREAKALGIAILVALVVAAPYLVRNTVFYGSPVYPALGPDVDRSLLALHYLRFGSSAPRFYGEILFAIGPWVLAVFTAGLLVAIRRSGRGLVLALLVACLVLIAAAPLMPVHDARHLLPVAAVMALLGAIGLEPALRGRRWAASGMDAALLLVAAVSVVRMPDHRAAFDLPVPLAEAYDAIRARTPEGAMILSLWTYDTAYYTGRPATWPIPWGQKERFAELFTEEDPGRLAAGLARHHLDYVLMPIVAPNVRFDGSNYSRSFLRGLEALERAGRLTVPWHSEQYALLRREPASEAPAAGAR